MGIIQDKGRNHDAKKKKKKGRTERAKVLCKTLAMGPRAHRSDLEMGVGQFIHWHQEEKPSTEADELGEVLEGDEIIFFCSVLVFSKV